MTRQFRFLVFTGLSLIPAPPAVAAVLGVVAVVWLIPNWDG